MVSFEFEAYFNRCRNSKKVKLQVNGLIASKSLPNCKESVQLKRNMTPTWSAITRIVWITFAVLYYVSVLLF